MATATPDTSTLTSSEQVFTSYTLPQIRAIHKTLHGEIDDKSTRLRTQVGNSYRELLGTADTIVQMRQDMQTTQDLLAHMGSHCGRAVVSGKVAALGRFQSRQGEEQEGDKTGRRVTGTGSIARVRLLKACRQAFSRLLKGGPRQKPGEAAVGIPETRGDRLVLAAKVLVLSRLLLASFRDYDINGDASNSNDVDDEIREALKISRKTQDSLRRRLRRAMDKTLEKKSGDAAAMKDGNNRTGALKALCAYSLASSSGARDVLWHFLNVRGQALAIEFGFGEEEQDQQTPDRPSSGNVKGPENVLRGLDVYAGTLLDVQALIPKQLSDALAGLKKKSLLADDGLRALEGLRLDVYERWCGEDIQYFTPFIRHDDLDGAKARDMLARWADSGGETLLEGLRKTLDQMTEFKAIVDLRTAVLQHWIRNGGRAKGFNPSTLLDGMRKVINARLLAILNIRVGKLRLVGSEVKATLEAWKPGVTDRQPGLWDADLLEMDAVGDGPAASRFIAETQARLRGQNDAVGRAVSCYSSWHALVGEVGELLASLRRQRWDNDTDEIEDEETIEARQKLLSTDDPEKLQKRLDIALRESFAYLDGELRQLWAGHEKGADAGLVAMYILRVLRGIRALPPPFSEDKGEDEKGVDSIAKLFAKFGLAEVPSLHAQAAAHVLATPLEQFCLTLAVQRVPGRALWENDENGGGEPLPTHPSPGAFKLLRSLVVAMGEVGLDIWTPPAVGALKVAFGRQVADLWSTEVAAIREEEVQAKGWEEKEKNKEAKNKSDVKKPENTPKDASAEEDEEEEEEEEEEEDSGEKKEDEPSANEKSKDPEQDDEKTEKDSPEAATRSAKQKRRDKLLQWFYDICLFRQYVDVMDKVDVKDTKEEQPLGKLAEQMFALTELGEAEKDRMTKGSLEFKKRTSLLLGLLV